MLKNDFTDILNDTKVQRSIWLLVVKRVNQLTWTMAGSCGRLLAVFGGSQTVRSWISLPRKMMYSNTSSRGGIGLSVGRSSVPKERTVGQHAELDFDNFVLKVWGTIALKEEHLLPFPLTEMSSYSRVGYVEHFNMWVSYTCIIKSQCNFYKI